MEGILPAPESAHAIRAALDEAMKCKETGEEIADGCQTIFLSTVGKYPDEVPEEPHPVIPATIHTVNPSAKTVFLLIFSFLSFFLIDLL